MATLQDLIKIARARIKTVEVLMKAKDWDMAGYVMGYILECYLKAAVCSTLKLDTYPDDIKKDDQMRAFFQTHNFDRLLLISGMSDVFKPKKEKKGKKVKKGSSEILDNWSRFTFHYQPNWTSTRYSPGYWNKKNIKEVYNCLLDEPYGLIHQLKLYLK